ncbi:hypothetical protein ACFSL6_08755 [Paenibacillus thailandensis]|uniref:Uncharacterized protein n=1 Tax=Paenibacillus thailandensis TaxID=393250 RepID=A0ABW5QSZ1_9BACL
MIAIHAIHRRLADLTLKAKRLGGYKKLQDSEQIEIEFLLRANADLVYRLDALKELSFIAHEAGDTEWQHDLCRRIDSMEAKMQ